VSAVTLPAGAGNYLYLVAWEQGLVTDGGDTNDIRMRLCRQPGQVASAVLNLHQLETDLMNPGFAVWDQYEPRVATDGCRFAVAYGEDFRDSGDLDARVTTLHAEPISATQWTLRASESRAWPAARQTIETGISIVSRYDCAADTPAPPTATRYGLCWADANGAAGDQIRAQVYDGMTTGGGFTFIATACGGLTLTAGGTPALGSRIVLTAGGGATGILFGAPQSPPLPVCSTCRLGVRDYIGLPAQLTLGIPCNVFLIGATFACQGYTISGGPCFGVIGLSDTLLVQVR
jgi:hypothetical protein